jgi:hypothetical protein
MSPGKAEGPVRGGAFERVENAAGGSTAATIPRQADSNGPVACTSSPQPTPGPTRRPVDVGAGSLRSDARSVAAPPRTAASRTPHPQGSRRSGCGGRLYWVVVAATHWDQAPEVVA